MIQMTGSKIYMIFRREKGGEHVFQPLQQLYRVLLLLSVDEVMKGYLFG